MALTFSETLAVIRVGERCWTGEWGKVRLSVTRMLVASGQLFVSPHAAFFKHLKGNYSETGKL